MAWKYVRFPAIADQNEDGSDPTGRNPGELLSPMHASHYLLTIEAANKQFFLGHFQGVPRAAEGRKIRREWLRTIDHDLLPRVGLWVRFWDLNSMRVKTAKNKHRDHCAGAMMGVGPDGTLYLRDVIRTREEWPLVRELMELTSLADLRWCKSHEGNGYVAPQYEVGIEDVFWQTSMIQDLTNRKRSDFREDAIVGVPGIFNAAEGGLAIWPAAPDADKMIRAAGWIARASLGQFAMVRGGTWIDPFINECLAFDGLGLTHDDQVDAVSGCYRLLRDLRGDLINEQKSAEFGSLEWYRQLRELNQDDDAGGDDEEPEDY